ncbi:putative MFS family arabinose efflux permease [Diaminobutyricimonas aerilata]|uniref:Putative MFS family arabinose efflux permease n=1 Tax=Diaminobutyricimonas aerilata TaxID=1162967 RepID=A0A2M9CLN7_9MICO|nr:MFS transporter [Diaminobutyricimonas aerilata]PJJ72814.1 putative MFS family arabinose efflux permease [Diaminobutyricimonas aerilata]
MTDALPFRWRSVAVPVFAPALLFSIGEGAIIPAIPLVADDLGATLAIAGLVAAALTVGELLGNVPSGWLVSRIGERPTMIGAAVLSLAGLAVCVMATAPWMLGIGVLLIGLSAAAYALARHAFLTVTVPLAYRARALSTLGGVYRGGVFIGPFIAAAVIGWAGSAQSAFWIHVVACLATIALLLALPDPGRRTEAGAARTTAGLFRTLRRRRDVLARLGAGAALVGAMRASRQVILPLWAVNLGLDGATTALIIGVAGGVDFALFYVSGHIMDRFGRLWSALPSMIGLGVGHLVLAFTHDVPDAVTWFIVAAIVMSVANGIGSGILMTLGADLADPGDPAPFLGAWRFTGGLGGASAPIVVAAVTGLGSIAVAAGVMGVLGFAGAAILARYVPRYSPHR